MCIRDRSYAEPCIVFQIIIKDIGGWEAGRLHRSGRHIFHRTRIIISCRKNLIPVSYTHLDVYKRQAQYYPKAAQRCRWATQDCMTLDSVPYIGNYSKSTPNLYVATGFNKWGMTSSMVSAMLLAGRMPQYIHLREAYSGHS